MSKLIGKTQVEFIPKRYKTIRLIMKEYGISRQKLYHFFETNKLKRQYLDALIMVDADELESLLSTESTWGHTQRPVSKGKLGKPVKKGERRL